MNTHLVTYGNFSFFNKSIQFNSGIEHFKRRVEYQTLPIVMVAFQMIFFCVLRNGVRTSFTGRTSGQIQLLAAILIRINYIAIYLSKFTHTSPYCRNIAAGLRYSYNSKCIALRLGRRKVEEKKPNSLFIFIRKVFYVDIKILQLQNLETLGQDVKRPGCSGIRLRLRKDSELVKDCFSYSEIYL